MKGNELKYWTGWKFEGLWLSEKFNWDLLDTIKTQNCWQTLNAADEGSEIRYRYDDKRFDVDFTKLFSFDSLSNFTTFLSRYRALAVGFEGWKSAQSWNWYLLTVEHYSTRGLFMELNVQLQAMTPFGVTARKKEHGWRERTESSDGLRNGWTKWNWISLRVDLSRRTPTSSSSGNLLFLSFQYHEAKWRKINKISSCSARNARLQPTRKSWDKLGIVRHVAGAAGSTRVVDNLFLHIFLALQWTPNGDEECARHLDEEETIQSH